MAPKHDPAYLREQRLRIAARRRTNLTLMKRRGAWWVMDGGQITAGGAAGLTIDQTEQLVREHIAASRMAKAG